MTREHVFASWIREHFPGISHGDHVRRLVNEDTDRSGGHEGKVFEIVVRRVCADCNHGWMREMDNDVRPLIEGMLDGQARSLSIVEQTTVATWATKMMLTWQAANIRRQCVVGDELYRWFERHRQPLPGSRIWLCHYTDTERGPFVSHQWGVSFAPEGDPGPQPGDPINGFSVTFALGQLGFWLFNADLPGKSAGSNRMLDLIWPALSESYWPPPSAIGSEAKLLARSLAGFGHAGTGAVGARRSGQPAILPNCDLAAHRQPPPSRSPFQ